MYKLLKMIVSQIRSLQPGSPESAFPLAPTLPRRGGGRIRGASRGLPAALALCALLAALPAHATQEVAKEQIKGLDEQVQEIKTEVLSIAAELNRLEEKLLYPSDTQLAIFVSMPEGEKFRLDAIDIELGGKWVAHHLYSYKELEALQKGGTQRVYVGNVRTGELPLHVTVTGKSGAGSDIKKSQSFTISKGIGPKLVGVVVADSSNSITVKDW